MAMSLSNGVFYTVSTLYFTRVAGLSASTVGIGLTIAGAAAVAGAFGGGFLSDRLGAHRLLPAVTALQGVALLAFAAAGGTASFLVLGSVALSLRGMQGTARSAVLARGFTGPERIAVRAGLSVVNNIFVGLGTCLAGLALLADTAAAYVAALLAAGLLVIVSAVPLWRRLRPLPAPDPVTPDADRSPLRDRTYVAVAALNAVLAVHLGVQTVGVPLWVITCTTAPPAVVALLMVINTALIATLQVRAAGRVRDVRAAARGVALGGFLLAMACACYAASAGRGLPVAVLVLVLAAVVHTAGEIWVDAGGWALAFELAAPGRAGAYQGINQAGLAVGGMLAPLVVTTTVVDWGVSGWAVLGAGFALAGAATAIIVRRSPARAGHQDTPKAFAASTPERQPSSWKPQPK